MLQLSLCSVFSCVQGWTARQQVTCQGQKLAQPAAYEQQLVILLVFAVYCGEQQLS